MAFIVKSKMFESESLVTLETTVNLFLATIEIKNLLDVLQTQDRAGKYGTQQSFTATVVYKEDVVLP